MSNRYALVAATVLGALLLTAARLPLDAPEWLRWLRPDWALAVLLYWAMVSPARMATVWAWLMGLLVDVLYGDLLGLHALTLALPVFAATRFQQRLALFKLLQQAGFVAGAAVVAELCRALLRAAAVGADVSPFLLVPPLVTTAVFTLLVVAAPQQTTRFVE